MTDAPSQPPSTPRSAPVRGTSAGTPRGLGPPWLRGLLALPFALSVQALAFALIVLAARVRPEFGSLESWTASTQLLVSALTYLLVVPALWIAWRSFAGASLADMGHAGPFRLGLGQALAGLLGGLVLMSLVLGLGHGAGAFEIEVADWRAGLAAQLVWLPALALSAYFEELLLRGFMMQDLGRRSALLGLAVSSLVFAFLHGLNDNLGVNGTPGVLLGLLNIFLAGLLLGGLFLLTGRLWLPTGLHLGWNWATAVLFGLPVSGYRLPSLLATEPSGGSGLLSGGAFGPEGSVLALLVLGPAALLVVGMALKRGLRVPVVARNAPGVEESAMIVESGPSPAPRT